MPPSRASAGMPAPLVERPETEGVRIWIPLPVAVLGVLLMVFAVLLVLGPDLAGAILILAFFGLIPGLAIVRLLALHDGPMEVVLGIALSFAIAGLVSVTQAYFGGWSPTLTLGALVAITVAAVLTPLVAALVRGRRRRSSDVVVTATGTLVAWPSAVARSAGSPAPVGAPSVDPGRASAVAVVPAATFPPLGTRQGMTSPAAQMAPAVPSPVAPSAGALTSSAPPSVTPPSVTPTSVTLPAPPPAAPGGPVDSSPSAPVRPSRGRSRSTSDLPPPPPVAVIRKRPKAGPSSLAAGPGPGSRPNRATRSRIDQLVDDLADKRDRTQS